MVEVSVVKSCFFINEHAASQVSNLNNNQPFRCIVSIGSCSDTTDTAVLLVTPTANGKMENRYPIFAYPNPATNMVQFDGQTESGELSVRTLLGTEVYRQSIRPGEAVYLGNLPRSLYFFTIKTPGNVGFGSLLLE